MSRAPVVFLMVTAPPILCWYIVTLVCLYKRRNTYPIVGRGALILIMWNLASIVGTLAYTTTTLVYSEGVPCGMLSVSWWFYSPYVFGMVTRGWMHVFRLQIRNFLAESACKQQQQIEPFSINGYWCATHRKWTTPRYVGGVTTACFVVVMGAFFYLRASLTVTSPPSTRCATRSASQTTRSRRISQAEVFYTLRRARHSVAAAWDSRSKSMTFPLNMTWYMPFVIGVAAYTVANQRRMQERANNNNNNNNNNNSDDRSERNEMQHVTRELSLALLVSAIGLCATFIALIWFPSWSRVCGGATFTRFFYVCCFRAGQQSIDTSQRLAENERTEQADRREPGEPGGNPERLRDLNYILYTPHLYDPFIEFLRSEFSSENALFYHEAHAFSTQCVRVEATLSGAWTNTTVERPPVTPGVLRDIKLLRERCLSIYDEYVAINSIKQVNLPDEVSALVSRHVEQIRAWKDPTILANRQPSKCFSSCTLTVYGDSFSPLHFSVSSTQQLLLLSPTDFEPKKKKLLSLGEGGGGENSRAWQTKKKRIKKIPFVSHSPKKKIP